MRVSFIYLLLFSSLSFSFSFSASRPQDLIDGFRCVMSAPIVSLRRCLSSLQRNIENEKQLDGLLAKFDQPNWSIKAFKLLGVEGTAVFQLRRYLPLHIAQQASNMQHHLHKAVDEEEILSLKYSDPDLCPNICVLRQWNDNVSEHFIINSFIHSFIHSSIVVVVV